MNIRELLIKIGLEPGDAGPELDRLDGKVDKIKDNFLSLGTLLAGLFAGGALKSIIETADAMQTLENRLAGMKTASGDSFGDFEAMAEHAKAARMSLEDYTHILTGIGAATHELVHDQGDLFDITDTLAKGLKLAGANGAVTTGVLNQMVQALAVGKLQWEDLKVIVQQSDQFAGKLAEGMGMSLNQLIAATQGQGGGIAAAKVIEGVRKMRIQIMKDFAKLPMGWKDMTTIMTDRWEMFIARINKKTMAISRIANWFLSVGDVIEEVITTATKQIGGFDKALVHLSRVATPLAILLGVLTGFKVLALLTNPIALILELGIAIGLLYDDYQTWKEGGDSFIDWGAWKPEIDGATDAITSFRDLLKELLGIDFKNWSLKGEFQNLKKNIDDLITMGHTLADLLNALAQGDFTAAMAAGSKLMSQQGNAALTNTALPGTDNGSGDSPFMQGVKGMPDLFSSLYTHGNDALNAALGNLGQMAGLTPAGVDMPTKTAAGVAAQSNTQISAPISAQITIQQLPGESGDALAQRVVDGFKGIASPVFSPDSLLMAGGAK